MHTGKRTADMSVKGFELTSAVRGLHVYGDIWLPYINETLKYFHELDQKLYLKELQNLMLCITRVCSLYCSIRVYKSVFSTYSLSKTRFPSLCVLAFRVSVSSALNFLSCSIF